MYQGYVYCLPSLASIYARPMYDDIDPPARAPASSCLLLTETKGTHTQTSIHTTAYAHGRQRFRPTGIDDKVPKLCFEVPT